MKKLLLPATIAGLALMAATSPASATILFDTTVTGIQQVQNNPCVIGNSSCSEPANFNDIEVNGTPGGNNGSTYTLFSPSYIAGATGVVGNVAGLDQIPLFFTIGVDENIAAGASGGETLQFFDTYICTAPPGSTQTTGGNISGGGSVPSTCTKDIANSFDTPTVIPNANNGNGYSDFGLTGFSLTSGVIYLFVASVSNDTDGMEQFFIIQTTGTGPPPPASEPATLALLGVGLLALGVMRRRRKVA